MTRDAIFVMTFLGGIGVYGIYLLIKQWVKSRWS